MTGDVAGYDVIGDVHGNVAELVALLGRLGYVDDGSAWCHPERRAVFVGDLIDRMDGQLATIDIVRGMVDAGAAQVIAGNHEFNAVAFATPDLDGEGYLRSHNHKHLQQHGRFLDEVGFDTPRHREIVDWFRTLPMWLDLGDLRVVHACWSAADIEHLASLSPDHTMTADVIARGADRRSRTHVAVETVLKGPELDMGGAWYYDKGGHRRSRARAKWWDPSTTTLRDAALFRDGDELRDRDDRPIDELEPRPLADGEVPGYTDDVPVVFGHYWRSGELDVLTSTAACVDYSAGLGGPLVAYRWDVGDRELRRSQLVSSRD